MITDEAQARAWMQLIPQCDALAMERLERLVELLREENRRQNLISRATIDAIWCRHLVDSAQLLAHVPRETCGRWLDLGTGAGFPGLVIAILCPDQSVSMVEARSRRAQWLDRTRITLGLQNAEVIATRIESVPDTKFDVISARAFAPLDKLLDLSARFSTTATLWLLPKGASAQHELDELTGWDHEFHVKQSITDPGAGIIVGTSAGRKGKNS